jgi:hypothetical protein
VLSILIDAQLEKSAKRFFPDWYPHADKLYAIKFARNCRGEEFCYELPLTLPTEEPPGVPEGMERERERRRGGEEERRNMELNLVVKAKPSVLLKGAMRNREYT